MFTLYKPSIKIVIGDVNGSLTVDLRYADNISNRNTSLLIGDVKENISLYNSIYNIIGIGNVKGYIKIHSDSLKIIENIESCKLLAVKRCDNIEEIRDIKHVDSFIHCNDCKSLQLFNNIGEIGGNLVISNCFSLIYDSLLPYIDNIKGHIFIRNIKNKDDKELLKFYSKLYKHIVKKYNIKYPNYYDILYKFMSNIDLDNIELEYTDLIYDGNSNARCNFENIPTIKINLDNSCILYKLYGNISGGYDYAEHTGVDVDFKIEGDLLYYLIDKNNSNSCIKLNSNNKNNLTEKLNKFIYEIKNQLQSKMTEKIIDDGYNDPEAFDLNSLEF